MRGNQLARLDHRQPGRSIPAYAGEPHKPRRCVSNCGVYPRVCGGTHRPHAQRSTSCGLSPRMRGNPNAPGRFQSNQGSIPAYAGEPTLAGRQSGLSRLYPRVCGGTHGASHPKARSTGLSPRMRGNRVFVSPRQPIFGSIPAYAGEPARVCRTKWPRAVYPRVCGGTRDKPRRE